MFGLKDFGLVKKINKLTSFDCTKDVPVAFDECNVYYSREHNTYYCVIEINGNVIIMKDIGF